MTRPHSPKFTQRIFWPVFADQAALERLLAFFSRRRALTDEISFFTEGDGGDFRVPPPDEITRRAEFLNEAVTLTRQHGFRTAINILNTLGHSDDGDTFPPPFRTMEGIDGTRCHSCACPADPAFLAYVAHKYRSYGSCQADTYWLDDDIRFLHHAPIRQGCFCPECIADFSQKTGQPISNRNELTLRLQNFPTVRTMWMERNTEVMHTLIETCGKAVHSQSPRSDIGFMTGCRQYFQDQFNPIHSATANLQSIQGEDQCVIRVGAGYWGDGRPRDVLSKLLEVAVTASEAAPKTRIAYELENYPFTRTNKAAHSTGLEVLLAILTNNLDEVLLDVTDLDSSGLSSQESWFDDLQSWTSLWRHGAGIVAESCPTGWKPAFSLNHWRNLPSDTPLFPPKDLGLGDLQMLQLAGVPVSGLGRIHGWLLSGRSAQGMAREELEALLEKPVIMDAGAALRFCAEGIGNKIGIRNGRWREKGTMERFTDHHINGSDHGYVLRATSSYFLGCPSASFEVTEETETLSHLVDYAGVELGAATFLFRGNGIRTAVLGHLPEPRLMRPARIRQWRKIASELAENSYPSIQTDYPVVCWLREDAGGNNVILILWNAGFDPARDVRLEATDPALVVSSPGVTMESAFPGTLSVSLPAWAFAVFKLNSHPV